MDHTGRDATASHDASRSRPDISGQRVVEPTSDPVCDMEVDVADARRRGMTVIHQGTEYALCSEGCYLEFVDDPAWFLDPAYIPSMM